MSVDAPLNSASYDDDFIHFSKLLKLAIAEEVKKLYELGWSLEQVAGRLKISKSYVRSALIRADVSLRPSIHTPEGKRARKLRRIGGAAPYGFVYLRSRLVVHPSEFEVVQMIVGRFQKNESLSSIARQLNAKKTPTKRLKKWDHSMVNNIVKHYCNNPKLIQRAINMTSQNLLNDEEK